MQQTTTTQPQQQDIREFKRVGKDGTCYINVEEVERSLDESDKRALQCLKKYFACANFLSAAQLYLKSNFLLREPLKEEHIKDRLLGHWGTCPGINFVYAQCNYLIKKHNLNMLLVLGPGHGAPAMLSNLYMTGDLQKYYPKYSLDYKGVGCLMKDFSWPGGFPSHVNPEYPGSIHEGGELGYALSVSYGAVMDNPGLIVTCIVGDGEAETGPTAAAWHSHKFIDPKQSGAVIPILHLNGYKITSPTLLGTMSHADIFHYFTGLGYQVRIVHQLESIDVEMFAAMEWALSEIRSIQNYAREGTPIHKPRWPLIVLQTPKGWTGIKRYEDKKIEGSYRSHQIPLNDCKTDHNKLIAVEKWLRSYHLDELFDENGSVRKEILSIVPSEEFHMGTNRFTNPQFNPLNRPDIHRFEVRIDVQRRGEIKMSPTEELGHYLAELWKQNSSRFKIFSPDELESNKLAPVFNVTRRNYQWYKNPMKTNRSGGVLEILSEHTCQGWLQGYTLTGRYGLFPSYETFLGIVTTMMVQYAKFIHVASTVKWRHPLPSLTYLETSTLWRQEHNGFSHQNPGFLNSLINMKSNLVRIYLPPDTNCLICTMDHCFRARNFINLVVSTKLPEQTWLTMSEAIEHCRVGASVWKWASTDNGLNPDVVLVGCGNEVNTEVIAASLLLRQHVPKLRVRVVNLTDLMILDAERKHPHFLTIDKFNALFTEDRPVIFNFHGYPSVIKQLIHGKPHTDRVHVLGYCEEGTTTTPFKMLTSNGVSRFNVCIKALQVTMSRNEHIAIDAPLLIARFQHFLRVHDEYIVKHGSDPPELQRVIVEAHQLRHEHDERTRREQYERLE